MRVMINIRPEHITALIEHTRDKLEWLRQNESVAWMKDAIPDLHNKIIQAEQDLEYFRQFKLEPNGAQG